MKDSERWTAKNAPVRKEEGEGAEWGTVGTPRPFFFSDQKHEIKRLNGPSVMTTGVRCSRMTVVRRLEGPAHPFAAFIT